MALFAVVKPITVHCRVLFTVYRAIQVEVSSCCVFVSSSVSVAEWLKSPPRYQQVDLEGLGSNPGAGKLDLGFQLSVNEYQLRLGLKSGSKIHFDHLEGVDEVDPKMARKINLFNFNFNSMPFRPTQLSILRSGGVHSINAIRLNY